MKKNKGDLTIDENFVQVNEVLLKNINLSHKNSSLVFTMWNSNKISCRSSSDFTLFPKKMWKNVYFFGVKLVDDKLVWKLDFLYLNNNTGNKKSELFSWKKLASLTLATQWSMGRSRFLRIPCKTDLSVGRCTSCKTNKWDWNERDFC